MTNRMKSRLIGPAVLLTLLMSGGASRLQGAVPAPRKPAHAPRKTPPAPLDAEKCGDLALQATIAKARMEMRAVLPQAQNDLAGISAAMNADRRVSDGIKRTFGDADLIKAEYSSKGGCVVTLKLPLDRLRLLAQE